MVANRVAEVTNGERLEVLQHNRRFVQVKTPQGAVGWIQDHAVIDQGEYDKFEALTHEHANEQPVATALLYSELYMHLSPGRMTQRFYLVPANTKVTLLQRASVSRAQSRGVNAGLTLQQASPQAGAQPSPSAEKPKQPARVQKPAKAGEGSFERQFLPAVAMEDWWLVRDGAGHTGWMLARDLQVDVPDDVAQYAENEKMIGAYVLRMVSDPDSGKPNGQVPEYLTVSTPYKDGLPFDFDQVRVFTWDTKRHRYGTAFRERNLLGFFPVKVTRQSVAADGTVSGPSFSFQAAMGHQVSLDPETGEPRAADLQTMTYRMEGNLVRRVLPAGAKAPEVSQPGQRPRSHRRHKNHVR